VSGLLVAAWCAGAVLACGGSNVRPQADAGPGDGTGPAPDALVPTDAPPPADAPSQTDAAPQTDGVVACSSSLGDVSQPLCDGAYAQSVGSSTFPSGSVIRAANFGKVRFTGPFDLGSATSLTFRGIVFASATEKNLGMSNVFEDASFVGGPSCGNTVNTLAGSSTTIRRAAFYGPGGRYQLLIYQQTGVVLEDVIFRRDGGWGAGSSACTEFEPTAAVNIYDSSNSGGTGVVVFDSVSDADSSAEDLGELTVNCHAACTGDWWRSSLVKNPISGAFKYEGMGTVANAEITNSVAKGGPYGLTRNVAGTTTATAVTLQGSAAACAAWKGAVNLTNSSLQGTNDCTGSGSGTGATLQLNTAFLDDPRWRDELCTGQSVTRGWCGTALPLSQYLAQ
jgi:hypothetical protein